MANFNVFGFEFEIGVSKASESVKSVKSAKRSEYKETIFSNKQVVNECDDEFANAVKGFGAAANDELMQPQLHTFKQIIQQKVNNKIELTQNENYDKYNQDLLGAMDSANKQMSLAAKKALEFKANVDALRKKIQADSVTIYEEAARNATVLSLEEYATRYDQPTTNTKTNSAPAERKVVELTNDFDESQLKFISLLTASITKLNLGDKVNPRGLAIRFLKADNAQSAKACMSQLPADKAQDLAPWLVKCCGNVWQEFVVPTGTVSVPKKTTKSTNDAMLDAYAPVEEVVKEVAAEAVVEDEEEEIPYVEAPTATKQQTLPAVPGQKEGLL